jgi:hypothetical protein
MGMLVKLVTKVPKVGRILTVNIAHMGTMVTNLTIEWLETLVPFLTVVAIVTTEDTISVGLHVNCSSFISDFNLTLIFWTDLANFSI